LAAIGEGPVDGWFKNELANWNEGSAIYDMGRQPSARNTGEAHRNDLREWQSQSALTYIRASNAAFGGR
jgi:hypothetical protein